MGRGNLDDRLSNLPDDILVNILNRLNVPDVARTSVLSRRWSQLPAMLSRLTISAQDFLPKGTSMSDGELVRINAAVVEATKSILARRDPCVHTIHLLSTTFYLRDDTPTSIGQTVGDAMSTHKIEKAEFTILTEKERLKCTVDDMVYYGTQFVSFFNDCVNAFGGLTRLYMENLRFGEVDIIQNILTTCRQLKYLGFLNCDTESSDMVQVEHAQLSELSIVNCRFEKVNLTSVPKLTRITFEYWMAFYEPPLSFGYVPLLEVANLANVALSWHKMVKLSTFLSETSVRDLKLGFKCEKIWVQPECLTKRLASVFHQLRIVTLVHIPEGCDLTWTMFILEAAPSVEELNMTVIDHPCEMEMDEERRRARLFSKNKGVEWVSTSGFKHHRLAKLVIFCFHAEDYMVSYVRSVMEAAVNLEDVFLYNRLICDKCQGVKPRKPTRFPRTKRQRCSVKKRITQGIESFAIIHFPIAAEIRADHCARML